MTGTGRPPFSSRIEVYTALKATTIDEMQSELAPIFGDLVEKLVAATQTLQRPRGAVVELSEAMLFLLEPAAYSRIYSRKSPPRKFVEKLRTVLAEYERNTGLVAEDVEVRWEVPSNQTQDLVCAITFTCQPLQAYYSQLLGVQAPLSIEVAFNDENSIFDVRFVDAEFLEFADLLMLRASFGHYLPRISTWAWLRRPLD